MEEGRFCGQKQQMLVAGCSERRVPHLAHSGGDHETFCLDSYSPAQTGHVTGSFTRMGIQQGSAE